MCYNVVENMFDNECNYMSYILQEEYNQMSEMIKEEHYSLFISKVLRISELLIKELEKKKTNDKFLKNYNNCIITLDTFTFKLDDLYKTVLNNVIKILVDKRNEHIINL